MVKENSFEARSKKNRKRSSILKMSDLRNENSIAIQKDNKVKEVLENREVAATMPNQNLNTETTSLNNEIDIQTATVTNGQATITANPLTESNQTKEDFKILNNKAIEEISSSKTEQEISNNIVLKNLLKDKDNFFNLNVKNDVFVGKMTTIRVYNDILDTIKEYAAEKNYNIIDFTNKVITLGLDDIESFGIVQITEVKLKNTGSKSIMYNLTEYMEEKLTSYINSMNEKGYKVSRNLMLNVILNETLKKFYK